MLFHMRRRIHILGSACNIIRGPIGVLGWPLRSARPMLVPKAVLAGKLFAAESQLAACANAIDRKKAPKPRFTLTFRLLWIVLSKWLPDRGKLAYVMQPSEDRCRDEIRTTHTVAWPRGNGAPHPVHPSRDV